MRDVLVEGDLDREAQRVAATLDGTGRAGRGLDGAAARAYVLLPLDFDDLVLELDDVDHLRALGLSSQRLQRPATRGAFAIRFAQLAAQRHAGQRRLLRWAVAGLFAFRLLLLGRSRRRLVQLRRLLLRFFQQLQRDLQLTAAALE